MKENYFWNDKIPEVDYSAYDSPEALLYELMNKDQDRWSYISSREEYHNFFEEGKYIGMGFSYQYDGAGNVFVRYVYPESPADKAGMKRSDKILEINGTKIDEIAEKNLWETASGEEEIGIQSSLKIQSVDGTSKVLNMTKEWISIRTVLYHDIIKQNGVNIGYLVFNSFIETSKKELEEVFEIFYLQNLHPFHL